MYIRDNRNKAMALINRLEHLDRQLAAIVDSIIVFGAIEPANKSCDTFMDALLNYVQKYSKVTVNKSNSAFSYVGLATKSKATWKMYADGNQQKSITLKLGMVKDRFGDEDTRAVDLYTSEPSETFVTKITNMVDDNSEEGKALIDKYFDLTSVKIQRKQVNELSTQFNKIYNQYVSLTDELKSSYGFEVNQYTDDEYANEKIYFSDKWVWCISKEGKSMRIYVRINEQSTTLVNGNRVPMTIVGFMSDDGKKYDPANDMDRETEDGKIRSVMYCFDQL